MPKSARADGRPRRFGLRGHDRRRHSGKATSSQRLQMKAVTTCARPTADVSVRLTGRSTWDSTRPWNTSPRRLPEITPKTSGCASANSIRDAQAVKDRGATTASHISDEARFPATGLSFFRSVTPHYPETLQHPKRAHSRPRETRYHNPGEQREMSFTLTFGEDTGQRFGTSPTADMTRRSSGVARQNEKSEPS
jgi:hypothetical protein